MHINEVIFIYKCNAKLPGLKSQHLSTNYGCPASSRRIFKQWYYPFLFQSDHWSGFENMLKTHIQISSKDLLNWMYHITRGNAEMWK